MKLTHHRHIIEYYDVTVTWFEFTIFWDINHYQYKMNIDVAWLSKYVIYWERRFYWDILKSIKRIHAQFKFEFCWKHAMIWEKFDVGDSINVFIKTDLLVNWNVSLKCAFDLKTVFWIKVKYSNRSMYRWIFWTDI